MFNLKDSYARNKFLIVVEGMSANILGLGIQGFALTALALYFKCPPLWISIITTLPLGMNIMQIFLPRYYRLFKSRKRALIFSAAAGRLPMCLIFPMVLADIVDYRYLAGIVFIYSFFSAFLSGIWTSSMGSVIEKRDWSGFFSKRFTAIAVSTVFFSYTVSNALQYTPGKAGILILTGTVAIAAVATIILLIFHTIPDFQGERKAFSLKTPRMDSNFVNFLFFIGMWNFCIEFTKPYFYYFAVVDLGAPFSLLGASSSLTAVISIFAFFIHGRLIERVGNKKMLSFGIFVSTYIVLFYFLMNRGNVSSLIMMDAVGTSIGWSAINLSLFGLLLDLSSKESDSYVALYSVTSGILGLTGALLGGYAANFFHDFSLPIFGDVYSGFQVMFLISFFLRFYCILLLTRVRAYQKSFYYPGIAQSITYIIQGRR